MKAITCWNNLKSAMLSIQIYSGYYENEANPSFMPPSMDTVIEGNYLEKSYTICPLCGMEYRFVPYRTISDESASRYIPVLIDKIGCHAWHPIVPWQTVLPKTHVAFADGHVEILENLTCYMDIFRKYVDSLSEENAEILKKYCKEWDNESR